MLCMGDSRNAAVVARAGAIYVSVAREGTSRPANRELAWRLLAVMCRRPAAAQVDVVASGGIPALTRCVEHKKLCVCVCVCFVVQQLPLPAGSATCVLFSHVCLVVPRHV